MKESDKYMNNNLDNTIQNLKKAIEELNNTIKILEDNLDNGGNKNGKKQR